MRVQFARATAVLVLLPVIVLAGCGSRGGAGGGGAAVQRPPADEETLARFVGAEKDLDAAELAGALGAGADLGKAADGIRGRWDAARKRILSSLGPDGVVHSGSRARYVSAHLSLPDRRVGAVRLDFDFASMAWATWSLGLLYLGNNASGTSEHASATSGDVTTRESTTIVAVKQGPTASVKLSTTRVQTARAGWSVSQTGSVELELPLCPDQDGVIAFDMHLKLETTGSSGTGATSSVTDVLNGHTIATVDDDARLASVAITGSYNHDSSARGTDLAIPAGQSSIHVDVAGSSVTASGTGDASAAQVETARALGGVLLFLAGGLAAARAGDFYEHGYCTEIEVAPDNKLTEVALGATQPFDVHTRHKWDGTELTDHITARLDGAESVSPTGRTRTPVTLSYLAPNQKNRRGTIHIQSRSRRGIANKDVAVKTPGGYAIHDVWKTPSGLEQHMDAVNCDSPYGPWHVVISGDLAAGGWRTFNAFLDIEADPNTSRGTVHGEEHSVTTHGDTYDGPSTGTAQFTPTDTGYLIKLEIDDDITVHMAPPIVTLPGQGHIGGHKTRELHVIPATDAECGP